MNLLTVSRLQAYRRCPREERLRYQLGLRTEATDALRFGTLIHRGLEAWWLATEGERLRAALAALTDTDDPFDRVRAECLLTGYDERWGAADLKALAVEHEFRLPLLNPETGAESKTWQLAGKIDVIAVGPDGCVVIEHKTSSMDIGPGSDYIARLRLDGQVSMYLRAARELGHEPVGVLYDVLGKIALRPYQATPIELRKYTQEKIDKKTGAIVEPSRLYSNQRESDETIEEYRARVMEHIAANPDDYYQRATVVRLEDELREFERELWQMGQVMRDAVRLEIAPRNPEACSRYGSMCNFWPICSGEASVEAYQTGPIHPELSEKPERGGSDERNSSAEVS